MLQIRNFRSTVGVGPVESRRARPLAGLPLVLLALAACASPRYVAPPPQPSFPVPLSSSASAVFRPTSDATGELSSLPHSDEARIVLRRAWLELELHHPERAMRATSQILYGPDRPSANEEAMARYLRAKAYEIRGTPELGRFDLDRARELALDPELVRRIERAVPHPARRRSPLAALPILGRRNWNAAAVHRRNLDPMDTATRITIHHSAMPFRSRSQSAAAAQVHLIQREHMKNRDYGDIGYHFLVDPAGRIWQGRALRWQGAHASGRNNIRNIGICLLGNFVRSPRGQDPTPEQVDATVRLVEALRATYHIPRREIHRHSDFKATQCPGPRMDPVMALLRGRGPSPHAVAAGSR